MEQAQKIEQVVNGLSQMSGHSHKQLDEFQEKLATCLTQLKNGSHVFDADKEEIVNLASIISSDLKNLNSKLPNYVEAYEKELNQISQKVQVIKEKIDFSNKNVNVKDEDLDTIADQFIQIQVKAEGLAELDLARVNGFKVVSRQGRLIQEFIQEVAGTRDEDGNVLANGNKDSSFLKEKIEELENLPKTQKAKVDTLVEQSLMDNNLIIDYCQKAKEALLN